MRILGIDPGANGALALIQGHAVELHGMPNLKVKRGKSDKAEVDAHSLWSLLSDLSPDVCYLEQVGGRQGQSASAAFNFGRAAGAAEYLCIAAGIRLIRVAPNRWKRALRLPSGKDEMKAAAMRLWPAQAAQFGKARVDFAEAALIAEYGRKQEGESNVFD